MRITLESSNSQRDGCIFVIEADEVIRSALRFILEGQRVTYAFASLDRALAEASNRAPVALLLGIDFLQNNAEGVVTSLVRLMPSTKILLVANSLRDPLAATGVAWGAHGVLGKPITFDSVCGKVDSLLGLPQLPQTSHHTGQRAAC